jgi:hypothetical protein
MVVTVVPLNVVVCVRILRVVEVVIVTVVPGNVWLIPRDVKFNSTTRSLVSFVKFLKVSLLAMSPLSISPAPVIACMGDDRSVEVVVGRVVVFGIGMVSLEPFQVVVPAAVVVEVVVVVAVVVVR